MPKLMLLILGLILSFSLSANEKIRGHYKLVGNKPDSNSIKKVVFEEFINFGCSHCNKLHKASKDFRKKFADKIEFVDIPIVFKGQDDSPLRLYYVARKIGKGDLIKDELFKASFIHGVNVFDPGITNYLARSLGIRKKFQEEKSKISIQRFKGLGEMNPSQLRETTMNPGTRRLIQLEFDRHTKAEKTLDLLLARKRSGDRKTWLGRKGDQAEVD